MKTRSIWMTTLFRIRSLIHTVSDIENASWCRELKLFTMYLRCISLLMTQLPKVFT